MRKVEVAALLVLFAMIFTQVTPTYARSGCCSHHGGVSGCGCADGTPLSSTCLPYYPECSGGSGSDTQTAPQTQTYIAPVVAATATPAPVVHTVYPTTTPTPTSTSKPTPTPKPTVTPKPTKQPTPTKKQIATPTQTLQPQINLFSWLFGLLFGQPKPTVTPTVTAVSAGEEKANSQCKAVHINPADPQAYLPDANCTPGTKNSAVTQATISSTICVSGYTKTIRPSSSYTNKLKEEQIQQYGYIDTKTSDYEEDHYISLELGGNPSDPKNLWPEPHSSTNEKDKVENYLHKEVCDETLTLAEAQKEIAANWYQIYQQIK